MSYLEWDPRMQLEHLVSEVREVDWYGASVSATAIEDIVIDSREARPGTLFVALPGTHVDGHDYLSEAVEAGAAAVLVERERAGGVSVDVPVLVAPDTRRALGPLAAAFFDYPSRDLWIAGITGTNGKTTTSFMVESVLRQAGVPVGLVGTVCYRWPGHEIDGPNTTPESLELQRLLARMRDDGVECVVAEVSSHGLETHRLRGTDFDLGVFTNLSQDHLDFHGTMEAYRAAKMRLFHDCLPESAARGKSPAAVVNVDDPVGRELFTELAESDTPVESFGVRGGGAQADRADYRAEIREATVDGIEVELRCGGETRPVGLPMQGRFNVSNALAALATCRHAGLDLAEIVDGLETMEPIPGRLERVSSGRPAVFVDYAHTPEALDTVLQTLRPVCPGRLVVAIGCGGDRDRGKRPKMGRVAAERADVAVFTTDNPRSEDPGAIIEAMLEGVPELEARRVDGVGFPVSGGGIWVEVDRGRAIEAAITGLKADDVLLIAGKGHETYQEIGGERRSFDDAERARRGLESHRRQES